MPLTRYVKHNGFTLLELLVAMTVFATMSIMAYGGLTNVISNSETSGKSLERLHEVQLTMFNIDRDLSQISQRNIRDEYGDTKNYVEAGSNISFLIELTRNGRRNPAKLLRSHLVRVAYKLEEGKLIRMHWPHLDRAQNAEPYESVLLTNVNAAELRYLDNKSEWHGQWPPLTTATPVLTLSAIEFKLSLDDWGRNQSFI